MGKGEVIELVTRCGSAQEFIERFARFTTETDVVVPALPEVPVGKVGQFVIRLKDQTVMMQGRCEVAEIHPVVVPPGTGPAPPVRALMRLHLLEMDAHSCGIHLRLMERHPPASTSPVAQAAAPLPAEAEKTEASPLPPPEARVPGSEVTLPANPLSDLAAADLSSFIDLKLLETDGAAFAPPIDRHLRLDRVRQLARRLRPYALGVVAGLSIGIGIKPSANGVPTLTAAALVRPAEAATLTPPPSEEVVATAAPRGCQARVTTTPPGAEVLWGDSELGATPIERATIPCGTATVTLRHDRYSKASRMIVTRPGETVALDERLRRPPARLLVTSSPSRAVIKVNDRRVGPTPRKINTQRFERVRIEASLAGYRPWRKTVYLKDEESKIDVTLVRRSR